METQFLHLAIKLLQIFSTIASHLIAAISHLGLFKSPPDSATHVVVLDGSSTSLLRVPVHVITATVKSKVPIVRYSDSAHRHGGDVCCMICLECIDGFDLIRELVNCEHVFHRECLDRWVDVGHVHCPLCRSMLLPSKKLISSLTTTAAVASSVSGRIRTF